MIPNFIFYLFLEIQVCFVVAVVVDSVVIIHQNYELGFFFFLGAGVITFYKDFIKSLYEHLDGNASITGMT